MITLYLFFFYFIEANIQNSLCKYVLTFGNIQQRITSSRIHQYRPL